MFNQKNVNLSIRISYTHTHKYSYFQLFFNLYFHFNQTWLKTCPILYHSTRSISPPHGFLNSSSLYLYSGLPVPPPYFYALNLLCRCFLFPHASTYILHITGEKNTYTSFAFFIFSHSPSILLAFSSYLTH